MMSVLFASYDKRAAQAISFLLHHVPTDVVRQFSYNYLYSPVENTEMGTEILVRPIPDESMMKGNIGRFLIYLRHRDGTEQHLKFTSKSATVYYLMYLIDRHQKDGLLAPLSLEKNKEAFTNLYCLVYDITRAQAQARCQGLIQREVDGKVRAGRENEVIYDIRQHLEAAFHEHGGDYRPYAMSARGHLAAQVKAKIHFLAGTETLLQTNFKWKSVLAVIKQDPEKQF